ncbi:MAG TPA: type II secretion system protein GspJ [Gemmatales bacterium]|nr:type II secretion system protein GspJ [Gemmatales bacterium]HMP59379.1 type II secretion system protein GspJ [Gemmatales bacterium]
MRHRTTRGRRAGYTLLEVVVSISIGLLLLAALYVALDVQLRYMASGQRAVAEAQLARGLLNRVAADVRASLAMLPTAPTVAAATGGTAGSATETEGEEDETMQGDTGATQTAVYGQYSFGLIGDGQQMTLFTSALPRLGSAQLETQLGMADQRRIVYGLVPGQGLVRQEVRNVASDDAFDPSASGEVLAPEVVALEFRYFDGLTGAWQTQWDGSVSGPPLAIEITLSLSPLEEFGNEVSPMLSTYRLVVSVPTAAVPNPNKGGAP